MVSHIPCYPPSPFNMLAANVSFLISMRHYSFKVCFNLPPFSNKLTFYIVYPTVEQTLGQHQLDNANTYLGVRELLRDDESRKEELDLIPTHL